MFREAWEADVYIADLTGNNPNVYLELGVRWAVRDGVSVVVSQNISEIKFNAAFARAIEYGSDPDVLENSINDVAAVIQNGLADANHCDSPVRDGEALVISKKSEIEALEAEILQLKNASGADLLAAARATRDDSQKLALLRDVVRVNPARIDGWVDLAEELRKQKLLDEAIDAARNAIALDPKNARAHKELGAAFSKQEKLDQAIDALKEAVRLDPKDGDSLSILGGAYRRKGICAVGEYDWDSLRRSRDTYIEASGLDENDTYPLLNVAKLNLLLSKVEPELKEKAKAQFEDVQDLCKYRVKKPKKGDDPFWPMFDLADSYLLAGDVENGLASYRRAMESVPVERRSSVYSSAASPLENLLKLGVVGDEIETAMKTILSELTI